MLELGFRMAQGEMSRFKGLNVQTWLLLWLVATVGCSSMNSRNRRPLSPAVKDHPQSRTTPLVQSTVQSAPENRTQPKRLPNVSGLSEEGSSVASLAVVTESSNSVAQTAHEAIVEDQQPPEPFLLQNPMNLDSSGLEDLPAPARAFPKDEAIFLGDYLIQPGDELAIKLRFTPDLDETVTVRPDGMISLPVAGEVIVAYRTVEDVRRDLVQRYGRTMKDPEIAVIVMRFAGNHVFVGGEVIKPGLIEIRGRMNSLQAVINAGGFRDTANRKRVLVRRDGGEILRINLKELIKGNRQADVMLRPYDVVYVPKSHIAKANEFVELYINRLLPFERSFAYFISDSVDAAAAIVP